MKQVAVVGAGMGPDTVTRQGLRAVEGAQALLGAPRLLELFSYLNIPAYPDYAPGEVAQRIGESGGERFAVLVSGDTGFYSAAGKLAAALEGCEITVVPGISSLSYFFARLQRPWQDAKLLSCHGRDANLVDAVRRNRLTFALTGGNIAALVYRLTDAGFGELTAHVGENLGLDTERILTRTIAELQNEPFAPLCVLAVENPGFDARVRFGIPDEEFRRADAPMTKREIRAVALSLLQLAPGAVCCDIGAGTGSVTVEMALAAYEGRVYAIERDADAAKLIGENCRAFHIGNAEVLRGSAPGMLAGLPRLGAAFIGGSGGGMREIAAALLRNNPKMRIVINAVSLENAVSALEALSSHGLAPEIVQVSAARSKAAGGLHMLLAQNPVFLVSGGGQNA